HQPNRQLVSAFVVGALELSDPTAFVERKHLIVPRGPLPRTGKPVNPVGLRLGEIRGLGRVEREIVKLVFVVGKSRHRRMAADDLPTGLVVAPMTRELVIL